MNNEPMTIRRVKEAVRNKYAWPGGYELAFVTSDGALLCTDCVRKNWRAVLDDMKTDYPSSGWKISAITYEAVSAETCKEDGNEDLISYCDQCNKEFGELA